MEHDLLAVVYEDGFGWTAACSCGRSISVMLASKETVIRAWTRHSHPSSQNPERERTLRLVRDTD